MPGVVTRHLKSTSGLRNGTFPIFGGNADTNHFMLALTGAPLTALVAGSTFPLIENNVPCPRSITPRLTTDATVINRTFVYTIYGVDQFGNSIAEQVSHTSIAASQIDDLQTSNVFSRVDAVVVNTATNLQAGDLFNFGLDCVGDDFAATDVIWGVPVRLSDGDDLLGGMALEGGVLDVVENADLTFVPGVNGVQLTVDHAPDAGNDRIAFINYRSTWLGR